MLIRSFAPLILLYDFAPYPAEMPISPVAVVPMNLRLDIFSFMFLWFEDYVLGMNLLPGLIHVNQVNNLQDHLAKNMKIV